jgi:regulator of protease activity HflC (stomatin/prohibitin superfamily)
LPSFDTQSLVVAGVAVLGLYLLAGIRQIAQWETVLKFTLGKFSGSRPPGLTIFLPLLQRLVRVDMRTRNRGLLRQAVITRDNVTLDVDAVLYYRVTEPEKAILAVESFETAMVDRAKVALRDIIGETRLDALLAHRDAIAAKVQEHVEVLVTRWGLHVELIGLQDIRLMGSMQEAMAKAAIAERERSYVIIKSRADIDSAKNFAEAARMLATSPGSLELRRFEALQSINQEGSSKVIFDLTVAPQGADETE